jgi:ABC-type molybdate transport system substrate-binding protein
MRIVGARRAKPASAPPGADANVYFLTTPPAGWPLDVVLTFYSGARSSLQASPALEMIRCRPELALTAEYGFAVQRSAANRLGGARFGRFLLTPAAQHVFGQDGFATVAP